MRRGLATALALCLAGAVLLLSAAGRTWTTVRAGGVAPLPDTVLAVPGSALVPGLRALGLLGLAGAAALLATRRLTRPVLGVLLAAAGALSCVLVARVLAALPAAVARTGQWRSVRGAAPAAGPAGATAGAAPYACLAGGVLLLAAGVLVAVRGGRWPALGARYEPPVDPAGAPAPASAPTADARPVTEKAVWDALDRGEDPTGAEP